ncbi:MFS transporter [Streptomyces inusitatus]|uniref:MFS transporter n=1 Tax=Streptomyces inusitatus TaxID=68221 RepID=A0A918UW18_9ACTN|nr:MFS transporter [Streptomyces inusitatus]GGZ36957.1 MFS transporter [Streptomyces inusitatus]
MPSESAPPRAGRREWWGLAVLALPTSMLAMDMTVLHLAAPAISEDLSPSGSELLWILDIYGFLISGFLISMGTLGDRIGRRRLLMAGATAFTAASVFAAYAQSAETLILARALLGVAGATVMPSALALISTMFAVPAQRAFAIAVWMTAFITGEAVGPLVGGVLLEFFWWGSVFLIAVPVMVLLLVTAPKLLPEHREARPAGRFDFVSAALSLLAVLSLVYAVKLLSESGAGAGPLGFALVGLAAGAAFVRRQKRLDEPLVDLGLFRVPAFSAALSTQTLSVCGLAGTQLLLMQYLQSVHELSPLRAGLWTLPAVGIGIVGTLLAPRTVTRVRPATAVSVCLVLAAVGAALIVPAGPESGLAWAIGGFTLLYAGVTPILALTADLIVGSAPPERAGAASAVSESGAELGLSLGMALLGSLGLAVYRRQLSDNAPAGVDDAALSDAQQTVGSAVSAAEDLPEPASSGLVDAARDAFTDGLATAAGVSAALLLATAALAAVMLRGVSTVGHGEEETEQPPAPERESEPAAAHGD